MEPIKHIGFGCVALSTFSSLNSALRLLETAYDCGIRHFDTAPVYGNGFSEKVLAAFLKDKKDSVSIATKAGLFTKREINLPVWAALPLHAMSKKIKRQTPHTGITFSPPQDLPVRRMEQAQLAGSITKSMSRMGINYIDYLFLHESLPHFLSSDALDYLMGLRLQGTVGKLGIAASAVNTAKLDPGDIAQWDVLQYENAVQYNSDALIDTFKGKEHIYHSVFKTLLLIKKEKLDISEAPGILLARSYLNNTQGKVLFSTTSADHMKNNLRVFEAYARLPVEDVKKIISDAIS